LKILLSPKNKSTPSESTVSISKLKSKSKGRKSASTIFLSKIMFVTSGCPYVFSTYTFILALCSSPSFNKSFPAITTNSYIPTAFGLEIIMLALPSVTCTVVAPLESVPG
jgi:hypothetical protein